MSTNEASLLSPVSFAGPTEFAHHVRNMLSTAATEGWRQMVWSDVNFEDWPLREKQVFDSLQAWARSGRTLTMLGKRYNKISLLHPRFVQWRTTWGHLVDCRVVKHLDDAQMPSAIVGPDWFLHRQERERSIGLIERDTRTRTQLKELLDECYRQSAPGFPATTLGL